MEGVEFRVGKYRNGELMVYLKRNTIGVDGMEYKFWNRKEILLDRSLLSISIDW